MRRARPIRPAAWLLALALPAAVLLGCAEDVTAVLGTDLPFELYGLLDPTADTQFVRVAPIEETLRPIGAGGIDARVTSTDLATGAVRTWRDSLLAFPDGTRGHAFWAAFRPEGGRSYRVDVTRSDGARSHAEVTVPAPPEVSAPEVDAGVRVSVAVEGASVRIRRMDVTYQIRYGWCLPQFAEAPFRYHPLARDVDGGQRIDLLLDRDFRALVRRLRSVGRYDPAYGLLLRGITIEAVVTDAAWNAPGGVFDPEVLVEPGTLSNVENGFGFVGSGYVWATTLRLPADVLAAAGFTPVEPPRPLDPDLCVR